MKGVGGRRVLPDDSPFYEETELLNGVGRNWFPQTNHVLSLAIT